MPGHVKIKIWSDEFVISEREGKILKCIVWINYIMISVVVAVSAAQMVYTF